MGSESALFPWLPCGLPTALGLDKLEKGTEGYRRRTRQRENHVDGRGSPFLCRLTRRHLEGAAEIRANERGLGCLWSLGQDKATGQGPSRRWERSVCWKKTALHAGTVLSRGWREATGGPWGGSSEGSFPENWIPGKAHTEALTYSWLQPPLPQVRPSFLRLCSLIPFVPLRRAARPLA